MESVTKDQGSKRTELFTPASGMDPKPGRAERSMGVRDSERQYAVEVSLFPHWLGTRMKARWLRVIPRCMVIYRDASTALDQRYALLSLRSA